MTIEPLCVADGALCVYGVRVLVRLLSVALRVLGAFFWFHRIECVGAVRSTHFS